MSYCETINIGECAIGGRVRIEHDHNALITISCLDWDTREVVLQKDFDFVDKFKLQMWLEDKVTTAYYADKIIDKIYT